MAIYLFRKKTAELQHHDSNPADFSHYLYQPEKDDNDELIHHREDHNNLLKCIINRLRAGHIPGVDLWSLQDDVM